MRWIDDLFLTQPFCVSNSFSPPCNQESRSRAVPGSPLTLATRIPGRPLPASVRPAVRVTVSLVPGDVQGKFDQPTLLARGWGGRPSGSPNVHPRACEVIRSACRRCIAGVRRQSRRGGLSGVGLAVPRMLRHRSSGSTSVDSGTLSLLMSTRAPEWLVGRHAPGHVFFVCPASPYRYISQ